MTTYQYNVYTKETYNATGKAKGDIIKILREMGIKDLYQPSRHRAVRIMQQWHAIHQLDKDSSATLIIQYPAVIDKFINQVAEKCQLIAIVHDLQSIRGDKTIVDEIRILNRFDVVISHNPKMSAYLKENGCKSKIVDLNIFDYLNDDITPQPVQFSRKMISFAGNLNKSEFVTKLHEISHLNFNLYGMIDDVDKLAGVQYSGMLPADDIVNQLTGEYGLIWDGDSLESCSGVLGHYLKYNNPHKLSLYLAAGKPVIVWKSAAIANFVKENQVGLTIDSISELAEVLDQVSKTEYESMRLRTLEIRKQLIRGEFTKAAITKALKLEEEK